jgi:pimeloyl-ACP methyl ester carboxylesterase
VSGRRRRWRSGVAAAGAGALVAALTPALAQPAAARPGGIIERHPAKQVHAPVPQLAWHSCGAGLEQFRCATAVVPLDYDQPHGRTISLELTKLPATDPAHRLGTLFTNPGGPGGSGVTFVQSLAQTAYSPQVRARYDILGYDPRGVAGSTPATCYRSASAEATALGSMLTFPINPRQDVRFIAERASLGLHCKRTSPVRFAHDSTANVARDMDLLRQAVGDRALDYVGYSYGTYLGATYAALFPGRVGRFVLDGTLEPTVYSGSDGDHRPLGVRIGQGPAAYQTYQQFLQLCARGSAARCDLAKLGDPGTVATRVLDRLKRQPLQVSGPDGSTVTLTYAGMIATVFNALYWPQQWPDLATLMTQVAALQTGHRAAGVRPVLTHRTASLLARQSRHHHPHPSGTHRRGPDYPSIGGSLASVCVDTARPGTPLVYPGYAHRADRKAPGFGALRAWTGITCEFLRARDHDAYTGPWRQHTKAPVLVIGTRYDPATPYAFTRPYAAHFANAHVLTADGWGHTLLLKDNRCGDAAVTAYLVHGSLPAAGATCRPDYVPFSSPGPGSAQVHRSAPLTPDLPVVDPVG